MKQRIRQLAEMDLRGLTKEVEALGGKAREEDTEDSLFKAILLAEADKDDVETVFLEFLWVDVSRFTERGIGIPEGFRLVSDFTSGHDASLLFMRESESFNG